MSRIEFSDRQRDSEVIWRGAPSYFVQKENQRLRKLGRAELRCAGLPDDELDDSQLAWVKVARTKDRIALAKAERKLAEVKSVLARR